MAQPSMSFASCSCIVLARDFGEKIPSYLHHQGENTQKSQEKGFIKISTNSVIDNIQNFTHLASAREGRSCETGQSPPVNEDVRDNNVRKDINLLHGNDVRCIVTHFIQNAFLPERKKFRANFPGISCVTCTPNLEPTVGSSHKGCALHT